MRIMRDDDDDIDEYQEEEDREEDDVRCARCRKWISAFASRCPECGVHFQGQAQDFDDEEDRYQSIFYGSQRGLPVWVIVTALVLLTMSILGAVSFSFW